MGELVAKRIRGRSTKLKFLIHSILQDYYTDHTLQLLKSSYTASRLYDLILNFNRDTSAS